VALWRPPTTFFMSCALGFASGVLIGAIAFEMMPNAVDLGSAAVAAAGFVSGFAAVYAFDLFVHRGRLAGEAAEQRRKVRLLPAAAPRRGCGWRWLEERARKR
jgi:ZIP family zinc transporter